MTQTGDLTTGPLKTGLKCCPEM